ncbi:3' terminal RNA ribose 2'-O-methyltransferase Hen1 [Acanthopleuribacter pedis]|uniref:Small RNA 2'-O-methyltransferase n=1 Tax=Acanthopleuribacter pedis TaxID=442870 RepID=A0A8J7QIN4_9BACT|nr:3' terminal RNA ribose 2'-O-methyltransferase Hen1 [Acanthopleuribacter pedis]MBO1323085.1 3' terminal RNA ribose 2'-O-methyltransferase Hen1 [Acanthopleuribacter pedis]
MLMTITTTHQPAQDLGFLLHKHPDHVQSFELSHGTAHVFYPESSAERCTAALLLDIDPIKLVRSYKAPPGTSRTLGHYVNDRPYVASSFLSTAISKVFGTALSGNCNKRPELAKQAIPLSFHLPALPVRGGEKVLRDLFEPLGYTVEAEAHLLDPKFPNWGKAAIFTVTLSVTLPLHQALSHLYVLIPALDREKHYYIGPAEIEKLINHGEGWLAEHPHRETITRRYMVNRQALATVAIEQLFQDESAPQDLPESQQVETAIEKPLSLNSIRLNTVVSILEQEQVRSVVDLGCGEGKLLKKLLTHPRFARIVGMDVSHRILEVAARRLKLDHLGERVRERIELVHGSLAYSDQRLAGFDAACLVEVIEHVDPERLGLLARNVFGALAPGLVVVTTPNAEFNATFEDLPAGKFRHGDHRFEWTRAEFQNWAQKVADQFGYSVRYQDIGEVHEEHGPPTQCAIFKQKKAENNAET